MQKQPSDQRVLQKRYYEKFRKIHKKTSLPEYFFDKVKLCRSATSLKTSVSRRCFLVKFVRRSFLQNTTERMRLIIAVKGELANKTVNYDTKTKAYVPFWARSVSH